MRISDWSSDVCSSDLAQDIAGLASRGGISIGAKPLEQKIVEIDRPGPLDGCPIEHHVRLRVVDTAPNVRIERATTPHQQFRQRVGFFLGGFVASFRTGSPRRSRPPYPYRTFAHLLDLQSHQSEHRSLPPI